MFVWLFTKALNFLLLDSSCLIESIYGIFHTFGWSFVRDFYKTTAEIVVTSRLGRYFAPFGAIFTWIDEVHFVVGDLATFLTQAQNRVDRAGDRLDLWSRNTTVAVLLNITRVRVWTRAFVIIPIWNLLLLLFALNQWSGCLPHLLRALNHIEATFIRYMLIVVRRWYY